MGRVRSSLSKRLARAISGPPRIPVSNRPFEATACPSKPGQPGDDQETGRPSAAVQEGPTPLSAHDTRKPPAIRQWTTRSRQEHPYEPAPTDAAAARQAALLTTFGSTLSDLDDDDDDNNTGDRQKTAERHGTGTAPPAPPPLSTLPTPPPTPRPTPPLTPLPTTPAPPVPLPTTPAPPVPLPTPGYFTGLPPLTTSPMASPPPGPPISPGIAAPGGPFPEDALQTVPWNRIRPGQRYTAANRTAIPPVRLATACPSAVSVRP
ncbi:vegetative cell wall protein gp1-like [Monomorium pharaonis]|uniref:vegetative cell wall protein gp1-like n=1 Tax=Monomorium pharaonis TaxID=307658 RepID=UPI00063F0092|nr:vegetative cell wall protein gp1-like [Monomorium pharaonis]